MNDRIRVTSRVEDWLPSSEYNTLRSEMLDKFDRIFKLKTFGVGAWATMIGFYFQNKELNNYVALIVLHLVVFFIGSFIIRLQKSIYRIGSYIQATYESEVDVGWHESNRSFDSFAKLLQSIEDADYLRYTSQHFETINPFRFIWGYLLLTYKTVVRLIQKAVSPFVGNWGADNLQHALLVVLLYFISVIVIWAKADFQIPLIWNPGINKNCTMVLIVLALLNLTTVISLVGLIFEKNNADKWKTFVNLRKSI